jgi:hypothetical protein
MMLKQRGPCECGVAVTSHPSKLVSRVRSPSFASSLFEVTMSLISQKDREMVIEALEYYIQKLEDDNCTEASIYAFNTLLRWIELEHFKNEN